MAFSSESWQEFSLFSPLQGQCVEWNTPWLQVIAAAIYFKGTWHLVKITPYLSFYCTKSSNKGRVVGLCDVDIQTWIYAAKKCLELQLGCGVKALGVLCKVSVTDDRSKFGPDFDLAITGEPKCVWMSKCESDSTD